MPETIPPDAPAAIGPAHSAVAVPAVEKKIGSPGQSVRALAFGGGAFDTIMQLGVVHALLVSEGKVPDVVAGLSAGAIQAAALAEILQAGSGCEAEERERARIARFRTFLGAAEDMSTELVQQAFPDMFEIHTQTPLQSPQLPVHSKDERDERDIAARSRLGLVNLMNAILSIRLNVGTATRGVLQLLKLSRTRQTWPKRTWSFLRLWGWVGLHLIPLGLLWGQVQWALIWGERPARQDSPLDQILATGLRQRARALSIQLIGLLFVLLLWLIVPLFPLSIAVVACRLGKAYHLTAIEYLCDQSHLAPFSTLILMAFATCAVVSGTVLLLIALNRGKAADRILAFYNIKSDLGNSHFLKQHLVQLFDPEYYGPVEMDRVLEAALKSGKHPPFESTDSCRKQLKSYWTGKDPIHVALLAADVSRAGEMVAVADDESLVNGLLAATAVTPLFEAQYVRIRDQSGIRQAHCIDAVNIANEPILGVVELLRNQMDDQAATAHVYNVSAFPITAKTLPAEQGDAGTSDALNIVDVGLRARQLQRFQNSTFEKRLVELYTRLLPKDQGKLTRSYGGKPHVYVGAEVYPIEPTRPLTLNGRLASAASNDERRRLVREAVAQGCRAAMETFIPLDICDASKTGSTTISMTGGQSQTYVLCQHAINLRRKAPVGTRSGLSGMEANPVDAPPSPGLTEICRECQVVLEKQQDPLKRVVALRRSHHDFPNWPHEDGTDPALKTASHATCHVATNATSRPAPAVIIAPAAKPAPPEPTVNLLFSGGVFRGVFQVGVVNALSEMGFRPSSIAGASVGSIMGAMTANVFRAVDLNGRRERIRAVAATFLALDQLVLTDRLVDFAGHLGLRAAAARFSPHDVDRLFRQFELPASLSSRPWRRVLAGIERLFYLNPFDLKDIALKFRQRRIREGWQQAKRAAQSMLDRYGVGAEFLGAEPLALLISKLVIGDANSASQTFGGFSRQAPPIRLLAMTTNLTEGRLDILGGSGDEQSGNLLDGLLAGSAFPAAFRPRWSREVFPAAPNQALYIDGGLMDNLPLDPLVGYLDEQLASANQAPNSRRPVIPHLVLTVSLNSMPPKLNNKQATHTAKSWRKLRNRAAQLSDNAKALRYVGAQKDFTFLHEDPTNPSTARQDPGWEPLNVEVITIIPKWLCGTFAFHPLLGFDREKQARSIAHGCASTFNTFRSEDPERLKAWRAKGTAYSLPVFDPDNLAAAFPPDQPPNAGNLRALPNPKGRGDCWFRYGERCPFSEVDPKQHASPPSETQTALVAIYESCGRLETHRSP